MGLNLLVNLVVCVVGKLRCSHMSRFESFFVWLSELGGIAEPPYIPILNHIVATAA